MKKQLQLNIELIADEYIVMMEDHGLEPMVEGDFVNHVISQVFNFKYDGNGTIYNKRGICKYLLDEFGYDGIREVAVEIGREYGVIKEEKTVSGDVLLATVRTLEEEINENSPVKFKLETKVNDGYPRVTLNVGSFTASTNEELEKCMKAIKYASGKTMRFNFWIKDMKLKGWF